MGKSIYSEQNIIDEKKRIRKTVLALRDDMPSAILEEKSSQIMKFLFSEKAYQGADVILTYVNYQSEVITTALIERALTDGKQVFAPKVTGTEMDFYRIGGMESLTKGYRGIREPSGGEVFTKNTGSVLMVMPGVVFDINRHRIGYGKGFYDRYLERLADSGVNIHTAALCYECQMFGEIPYEIHDRKPDMIITEKRVIKG